MTGVLRFEPGETAQTIEVATVDDGTQESTENFGVKLSNPNGATLSDADDTGTGTITDDDGTVSVPALSIADAAPVVEGVTSRFEVTLSPSSAQVVTVDYATADGTAVEVADYTAVTGVLRFEPGETAQTIEVATVDDGTQESTENFGVKLSNPNGATLSDADDTGTGTITDDDGTVIESPFATVRLRRLRQRVTGLPHEGAVDGVQAAGDGAVTVASARPQWCGTRSRPPTRGPTCSGAAGG